MSQGLVTASYIVAAVLFILSLAGLSKQETAKHGNLFGIAGMAIALLATVFNPETSGVHWIILAMVIGGAIGVRLALKVEMTEMPELVAVLHSFVGMAAVLVGFNSFIDLHPSAPAEVVVSVGSNLDATLAAARAAFEQAASVAQVEHLSGAMLNIHLVEVFLGVFIGAVTFTGSVVAFGKLRGLISSKPLMLPHRHKLNLLAVVVSLALMIHFVNAGGSTFALLVMTLIAFAFGWHLVASIGGADMPVVVSMLNSYSGCMLGNPALSVLADAYIKGIRTYDAEKAYRYAINTSRRFGNDSLGYAPEPLSISTTLEYAYTDWCISQLAKAMGKEDDAKCFYEKGQAYHSIFDKEKALKIFFFSGKTLDVSYLLSISSFKLL